MTQFGERAVFGPNDVCYRHAKAQSFTLCQRCGKTICPDCQTSSSVGVLCPQCMKDTRPDTKTRVKRKVRASGRLAVDASTSLATYVIMAVCGIVYIAQLLIPAVTPALWYSPVYSQPGLFEPWRMVTAMFTHSTDSIFHILFNMYTLWLFGRELERLLGWLNFSLLYLLAGIGGSAAVLLWGYTSREALETATVGASGAIFGVLAATLVALKAANIDARTLFVLIAINVGIGFLPGTAISWQAHLGGIVIGAAVMGVFVGLRGPRKRPLRIMALSAIAMVLVAISSAYFFVWPLAGALQ
jgi:membrane associated rhomboid family serine protease